MIASLTLTTPLLARPHNPQRVAAAVGHSAAELERDIKENIQSSVPAGRTYPRRAIVQRPTRRQAGLNLRTRGNRAVVGFIFHRASKSGQAPAILSGRLINSIGGRRIGPYRYRVGTSVVYAAALDNPQGLNRPFFRSRVLLYRPRFVQNIRNAFLG